MTTAFPRGGKRELEPLEYREMNDKLFQEIQEEAAEDSVQAQDRKKRKKNSAAKEEEEEEKSEKSIVSMFSFQKIMINSCYFGVVSEIKTMSLKITLPNNLNVYCSITEISSHLNVLITSLVNSDDDDEVEDMPDLNDYFTVGQQVTCKVLSLSTASEDGGDDAKTNKRIEVTINPEKVWSHIKDSSWVKGTVVDGVVESKQDYGFNVILSPTKKGFLKFKDDKIDYKIGSLVKVFVEDPSSSLLKVTAAEKQVKTGTVNSSDASLLEIDQLIPGSLVPAKISDFCDSGMKLNVFGIFDATIEASQLSVLDPQASFKLGQKLTARIVWVDIVNKIIGLSLLSHLVGLKSVSFQHNIGAIVDVEVLKVDARVGLLVQESKKDDMEDSSIGYVHISKISDSRIAKIDASYSSGSVHKGRVIGLDYCNGHLLFSLQPKVIAQPFIRLQDIPVASIIKGVVEKVESFGIIVAVTESIKGLCPTIHISDAAISHPEKLFKIGAVMSFRVISCDASKNRLILTHKKSLVRLEKEKVITEYFHVSPGDAAIGVIASVQPYGAIVSFFNNIRALAPLAELSTDFIKDPSEVVKVGMIVSCRVLTVDAANAKMRVTLKTSQIQSDANILPGASIPAKFLSVSTNKIVVGLGDGGNVATIANTHLCDNLATSLALFEAFKQPNAKKGCSIGMVTITKVDSVKGTIEATLKYAGDNTLDWKYIDSVNQLFPGDIIGGVVSNITEKMCFIKFGNVTGVANIHNVSDGFLNSISEQFSVGQSVVALVSSVESDSNRLYVSLKPSLTGKHSKSLHLEAASLQSLFHARKLIAVAQGRDKAEWIANFCIGSTVTGKVKSVLPVGFEIGLASKVTGLLIGGGKLFEIGQDVTCKVIDVDISSRIVDLVVNSEKEKSKKDSAKLESAIAKQSKFEAIVENTKDAYMILRIPSLGNCTAFATSRSLNASTTSAARYKPNQKLFVTLCKSGSDADMSRLIATPVKQEKPEQSITANDTRRLIKNPVDSSLSSLDDITFGLVISGKIQSVKETQLNIRLSDNLRGRVHVSEVFDSIESVDLKKPLKSFKHGDLIQCKVIGMHSLKTHKFLPISHSNPISQIGVELSIRPSVLANNDITPDEGKFAQGTKHIGFVHKVETDCVWVQLSPSVLGRVDALFATTDLDVLSNLNTHFKIGQAVACTVQSSDTEKGRLDLSIIERTDFSISSTVFARITHVDPEHGLSVYLGSQKYGRIQLADISDDYPVNPISSFKVGQFLKAKVVGIQGKKIDLICRENEMKLSDLEAGAIVQGYVRTISDKGCFVSIAQNVTARVKISELSDSYIKDWKSIYKVGQLVKGKIVSLDLEKNQIELSLKQSCIDAKMKLVNYSDLTPHTVMSGTVKKLEAFGLFIQLDNSNIRGLCHITEAAENPVKSLEKLYAIDDRVRVYLLKVDVEYRKVSLSLKASHFNEEDDSVSGEVVGSDVEMESDGEQVSLLDNESDSDDIEAENSTAEEENIEMAVESDQSASSDNEDEDTSDGEEDKNVLKPLAVDFSWNDEVTMKNNSDSSSSSGEEDDDEDIRNEKSKRAKKQEKANRMKEIEKEEELLLDTTREPEMPEDFERLLLGSPSDSFLWIKYMAFQLELAEIEKARQIAERALNSINFREQGEKLNVIVAYLNLENKFGSGETLAAAFDKACNTHDPKKIHIQMVDIYSQNDQLEPAEDLHKKMVKKFSASCKVWLGYATFLVKCGKFEQAREVLKRALQALPQRKHLKLLLKFGQMEFKQGSPERARTVFEGLIGKYAKKPDLWSIYIDMEIRIGDLDICRRLFERALALKWSSKKMKFFFKKYLEFEKKMGTPEGIAHVKQAAIEFVQSLQSS